MANGDRVSSVQAGAVVVLLLGLVALTSARPLALPLRGALTVTGPAPANPAAAAPSSLVRVNEASATELEALPGIGPALAARIVSYRASHGPFLAVGDLARVSGIGRVRVERLRALVSTNVEPNADAEPRREEQGVEEASVVGGHPKPAPGEADQPARVDQKIHAQ